MPVKPFKCNNLSRLNGISHGFFGRPGGASEGVYASLNCGPGSNDKPENVRQNRATVMQALGFADETSLYSLNQIHSHKAVQITSLPQQKYAADAMVTRTAGLALGILTADCTPILFADTAAGVIGAAHAGWKGAIGGVIENTILEMEKIGAARDNIIAAIGPTIAQESYEVGAEFYATFITQSQANDRFFVPSVKAGHHMFNLPLFVAVRLEQAGIKSIEDCALDTCADSENFFSYRRNCLGGIKEYGRNLSVIVINTPPK